MTAPLTGAPAPEGLVRPRFTAAGLEAPLPLDEHWDELFLDPARARPVQLFIEGGRGSGLSTTLDLLHARAARAHAEQRGRQPLRACELLGPRQLSHRDGSCAKRMPSRAGEACPGSAATGGQRHAIDRLEMGEAILFLDLSISPLDSEDRRLAKTLRELTRGREWLRRCWLVVATRDAAPLERWAANGGLEGGIGPRIERVRLAPWGSDELLELLGASERTRAERGRLLAQLGRLPRERALLERPRTARWIVDAALELDPAAEPTLAALYANFLDTLAPDAILAIRERARGEAGRARVRELLAARPSLASELAVLVEGSPGRRAPPLELVERGIVPQTTSLALPGLDHFLAAGDVVSAVASGSVPERLDREALPFVVEMLTPGLLEIARGWLAAPEAVRRRDAAAATLLWAAGEAPVFDARPAPRDLAGAILDGAHLLGSFLDRARLDGASLVGAALHGSTLREAQLVGVRAAGATFELANLSGARLRNVDLAGARLERVKLRGAELTTVVLADAALASADLADSRVLGGTLARADLSGANLAGASLTCVRVDGADFTGAALTAARLRALDLREARLAATRLGDAQVSQCSLALVDLGDVLAPGVAFTSCDLSGAQLRGDFTGARFERCRAHEVVFANADLRQATFESVSFHAGSSRAGLLLGKPALEGNKTGFYVEGTTDDEWTSPDAIRQASFRDCDLRGARFPGTNLFRIDLRGSQLDPVLRNAARSQGAILD